MREVETEFQVLVKGGTEGRMSLGVTNDIKSAFPGNDIRFSRARRFEHRKRHYGTDVGVFLDGTCIAWILNRHVGRDWHLAWGPVFDGTDAPGCLLYVNPADDDFMPGITEHIRSVVAQSS